MTDNAKTNDQLPAIAIERIGKSFKMDKPKKSGMLDRLNPFTGRNVDQFRALTDVNFEVMRGETVGIVGKNGSGKTTLLKIICGIMTPSSGRAIVRGNVSALLDLGAGFDPELTGIENVYMNGALMGFSKAEMDEKIHDIEDFADIGEFIHRPVKIYSSGMFVRLAFSVAIHSEPDILVIDETLAVGDEAFKRKCFARINQIRRNNGTILFVSHSLNRIVGLCHRAIWIDQGELLLQGEPSDVVFEYERFTHASVDNKEGILDQIRKNRLVNNNPPQNAALEDEILTKSARSYEPNGAIISNPRIESMDGEQVNALVLGEQYIYTYDVEFTKSCKQVRFGMMLRTQSGFNVGGMVSHSKEKGIDLVTQGDVISPRFKFRCQLLPEVYFMNSGVLGRMNGAETFHHRIVDAVMFRVLPKKGILATGLVDFSEDAQAELIFHKKANEK